MSEEIILELVDLKKHYPVLGGVLRREVNTVKALDGISLAIQKGECLGLVGESGCGKTTTGKAIVRLHPPSSGHIFFHPKGQENPVDIAALSPRQLKGKNLRHKLQMVFQDPTTSMNPRMLVKNIVAEPIQEQEKLSPKELEARVVELLTLVGLNRDHLFRYPHEFSGGQRQRIAVARAIATHPEVLVLDEPTSALDVSVQAQILNLLHRLRKKLNLTYLFVTHHLLVVKYISDRIAVMYLGKVVELADTETLFEQTLHPYTWALLSGIPSTEIDAPKARILLEGDVPSPLDPPAGCRFHTRCPFALDLCSEAEPPLLATGENHQVACHRSHETRSLFHSYTKEMPPAAR
ncbi:oligopeptide/dipeptide ABC transporter ATP-binding protein [Desulfoluna sp.]|uniref:ABC transporter ATP-binding protein n=1 Tax=Desulfoluna sp. TaxID=2045199 RepID=UPI0026085918|nr:oligopeptide/dipeptide ABC transporter ATP-binding protein [Desulfoluna sp.]